MDEVRRTVSIPPDTPVLLGAWDIPGLDGAESTHIQAKAGTCTVIVGANGAGKSALGWLLEQGGTNTRRVIAHRKLWFGAAGPDITSSQRDSTATNIKAWGSDPSSRYLDHGNDQRTGIVLFDLLARYNAENAEIADKARAGLDLKDATALRSILDRLNAVFAGAALPLAFRLTESGSFEAHHSTRNATYPISQMSDGEKSALLLSAEILSSPPATTFIIDEPERHLHRSISAGLVAALVADRTDAHFAILTHDLDLAASLPDAATNKFVLANCCWAGNSIVGWELHPVFANTIPDDVRRAVLGGRRQLLFVEGTDGSLDKGLYGALYPAITLTPVGSCDQVIRAVAGVRDSANHHWLEVAGLIDSDGREAAEVATLAARGVLVLPVSEIESLYYVEAVLRTMARRQADALGLSADDLYDNAMRAAITSLNQEGTPERLSASVAEKQIYRKATAALPDREALTVAGSSITIDIDSPYEQLLADYRTKVEGADFSALLSQFPIRDTPARHLIASALHYKTYGDYEAAALVRIRMDDSLAALLRKTIGELPGLTIA